MSGRPARGSAEREPIRGDRTPERRMPVASSPDKQAPDWFLDAPVFYPRAAGASLNGGSVAVADFDRDGRNDVVTTVAMSAGFRIAVYLQNQAGTLEAPTLYPVDGNHRMWDGNVAVGDLDGDGSFDIVTSSHRSLSVFYNDGQAHFTPSVVSTAANGLGWSKVAVIDDDRDGKNDIFALSDQPSYGGTTKAAAIFRNGYPFVPERFRGWYGFNIDGTFAFEIEVADVTSDGVPDLMYLSSLVPRLTVARSGLQGWGSYNQYGYVNPGAIFAWLGVGDFNDDGKRDVATAYSLSNNLSRVVMFYQNTLGTMSNGPDLLSPQYAGGLVGGDIDGDGDDDLLWFPQSQFETLWLYRQENGSLASSPVSLPGKAGGDLLNTDSVAMADLNGDGCKDIVASPTATAGLTVWYGHGCVRRRLTGGRQPMTRN